jgi:hypothetical protein
MNRQDTYTAVFYVAMLFGAAMVVYATFTQVSC